MSLIDFKNNNKNNLNNGKHFTIGNIILKNIMIVHGRTRTTNLSNNFYLLKHSLILYIH